jgi:hypothetical protein
MACSQSMGWCTPPPGHSLVQMTECDCQINHPGCIDWSSPMPGAKEWYSPERVFNILGQILAEAHGEDNAARTKVHQLLAAAKATVSSAQDFGSLGQRLAETYAGGSDDENRRAANERVVKELCQLISEANQSRGSEVGICKVPLTDPPTPVRLTQAQCAMIPGATWRPA